MTAHTVAVGGDTVLGVAERLRSWIELGSRGIVLLRFVSDVSRDAVLDSLDTRVSRVRFDPAEGKAAANALEARLRDIVDRTRLQVAAVLFPTPRQGSEDYWSAIRSLNFHRDVLAGLPLIQLWCVPMSAAVRVEREAPDLASWFLLKFSLRELPPGLSDDRRPSLRLDQILVAPGPREIPLDPPSRQAAALRESAARIQGEPSDLPVLSPWNDIVPYQGRREFLEKFLLWIAAAGPRVTVRTVFGRAGAGKTRFAVELLSRLQDRHPDRWFGGFLRASDLTGSFEIQRPTVAVFDYASTSADALRAWLESVARNPPAHPLRILLLDRAAKAEEGWLASLTRNKWSNPEIEGLFDDPEPLELPPVDDARQRWTIVDATLRAACRIRDLPEFAVPALGADVEFDRRLAAADILEPLHLQMAALASLDNLAPRKTLLPRLLEALALHRTDLATRLAQRESARLARFGAPAGERLRIHMAAYATLCGGLSRAETIPAIKAEADRLGFTYAPRDAADELAAALGVESGVPAIVPDIVGEAFVLDAFSGRDREEGDALVQRLGERAIPALIRMAQDFSVEHVLAQAPSAPLEWLGSLVKAGRADRHDLLLALESALPHQTLALRELAVEIDAAILDRVRSGGDDAETARFANNVANRLSDVGRREDALSAAEEAVSLRRRLAAARPDAFLPDLALSLNNVANSLSAVGRREDALSAAEEAVSLRRRLAAARPDAFLPDLATSVNNVAAMLSEVGRREDALSAAEEAVSLYRRLAAARPDAFLPYLAGSLSNVAMMLSEVGRREDALSAAEEAVSLYRRLAAARPDAFAVGLARSLAVLSRRRTESGDPPQAHAAIHEAVTLLAPYFERYPQALAPLIAQMAQDYLKACEASGQQPDPTLLMPIVERLQQLQSQGPAHSERS